MDPELYMLFAKKQLSDLAERRDDLGVKPQRGGRRTQVVGGVRRTIPVRSRSVCYSDKEGFRGSDSKFRLALAVRACEIYIGIVDTTDEVKWQACQMVAGFLLSSKELPLRSSLMQGRRGRKPRARLPSAVPELPKAREGRGARFDELDALIAAETRVEPIPEKLERLSRTTAEMVRSYRKEHSNHEQLFELWFGMFCTTHARDAEWWMRNEQSSLRCLRNCEKMYGLYHEQTAEAAYAAAQVFHQQGKWAVAHGYYQRAWKSWSWLGAPQLNEAFRSAMLMHAANGMHLSMQKQPPDIPGPFHGPRFFAGILAGGETSILRATKSELP